ncbi:MAG: hypothetical protein JNK67_24955 [Alphaproteobacteria bacterium]|nr:hypothetical protein [Alphaproteobacteria bacterium]
MVNRRASALRPTTLATLRRHIESVDRLLRANDAPQRAAVALSGEVRKHIDSLKDVSAADSMRLQAALTRLNALATRQSSALKKAAETASSIVARLR